MKVGLTRTRVVLGMGGILLVVIPIFTGPYLTNLLTRILILALIGVGFNLAFGFTDLPVFGHAAFYGLGAYGFAMALQQFPAGLILSAVIGLLAAFIYSIFVGVLSTRGRGIYFALLTFAFAQFLFEVFFRLTEFTGGSNGLFVTLPSAPFGLQWSQNVTYYLSFVLLLVILLIGYRVIRSPLGRVMDAIRHNEDRAQTVGYNIRYVKIVVFVLSATLTSVGGILHAINNQFVSPSVLFFQVSVDLLVISLIGGTSYLTGPIVGAFILLPLSELTRNLANVGTIIIGLIFVAIVLFAPEGLIGIVRKYI